MSNSPLRSLGPNQRSLSRRFLRRTCRCSCLHNLYKARHIRHMDLDCILHYMIHQQGFHCSILFRTRKYLNNPPRIPRPQASCKSLPSPHAANTTRSRKAPWFFRSLKRCISPSGKCLSLKWNCIRKVWAFLCFLVCTLAPLCLASLFPKLGARRLRSGPRSRRFRLRLAQRDPEWDLRMRKKRLNRCKVLNPQKRPVSRRPEPSC